MLKIFKHMCLGELGVSCFCLKWENDLRSPFLGIFFWFYNWAFKYWYKQLFVYNTQCWSLISATQILHEINFVWFKVSKISILTVSKELTLDFNRFHSCQNTEIHKKPEFNCQSIWFHVKSQRQTKIFTLYNYKHIKK